MIEDLDSELEKVDSEAIIIIGDSTSGNPSLGYVCGVTVPRGGVYIKKIGEEPVLVVGDLDTANAQRGLVRKVYPTSKYNLSKLAQENGLKEAYIIIYDQILGELGGAKGLVLAGKIEAGQAIDISRRMEKRGYKIRAEPDLVDNVRRTKSSRELDIIREVARRTEDVVRTTLSMLRECSIKGDTLQNPFESGKDLTVGKVKQFINLRLAEKNLIAVFDTIFAPGPDGADPHNHGTSERKLTTGTPIVFDIFPRDVESGYCFDTTRTFTIGKASMEVKKMYEDVLEAQKAALEQIMANANGKKISTSVCNILTKRGHKTPLYYMENPGMPMEEGFIHGLGHGVGLTIGEPPYLSLLREEEVLKVGDVVTVEPGVYYPNKWGIRIEDTVAVQNKGLWNFSTLEKNLEL
ncbi:MAG: M24 family metallopeptidase [Candidatus Thorarchaeota archaeon]